MNNSSVNHGGMRFMGISTAMLVATLAALLAVFVLAKPSGAAPTITVKPAEVGYGGVVVSADPETRTITIKNTGTTDLVIGGVDISGTNASDFSLATTINPIKGLTVKAGKAATLDVNFDPATEGVKEALLTLENLAGVAIPGAPQVVLGGTGVQAQPTTAPADCTIFGTNRGEPLTGTPNPDVICAFGGADKVNGLGNNDKMRGGSGNDRIIDRAGRDRLLGQGGKDRLNAKDGKRGDMLKGGGGRDKCAKDRRDKARSC